MSGMEQEPGLERIPGIGKNMAQYQVRGCGFVLESKQRETGILVHRDAVQWDNTKGRFLLCSRDKAVF